MAPTPTITYDALRKQIATKQLAPVYLLHGEEGYYIDMLVKEFENVLTEDEKVFNQYILYAPQVEPGEVMDVCSRLPMMADRQVVILKEAQAVNANQINRLHRYVQNPSPTTVFVICFRGEKGKGAELMAAAKAKGVVFESKKVTDYSVLGYIDTYLRQKNLSADQKVMEMLRDHIGLSLSKLYNEIDKLADILGSGSKVTPEDVERNIGISKDYNAYELVDALAARDTRKVFTIADYFKANPKAASLVLVNATLFGFFSDLLILYFLRDKSEQSMMAALKLKSAFPLKRFRRAMSLYNAYQVIEIVSALRKFDAQSKGNGSRQNEHELFHDLLFHILSAPGNIKF